MNEIPLGKFRKIEQSEGQLSYSMKSYHFSIKYLHDSRKCNPFCFSFCGKCFKFMGHVTGSSLSIHIQFPLIQEIHLGVPENFTKCHSAVMTLEGSLPLEIGQLLRGLGI